MTVFTMIMLLGFAALTVDTGLMIAAKTELQDAADAAVLAVANAYSDGICDGEEDGDCYALLKSMASNIALINYGYGTVLPEEDLIRGNWDEETAVFTPEATPYNAFQAQTRRATDNGNALPLAFAAVFGMHTIDIASQAAAIAFIPSPPQGGGARFLLDDEMFDTDVPVIEDLANSLGVDPDDLLYDLDGDYFIEIPAGEVLELPTGQVGDEGIFEMQNDFPFTAESSPSMHDFLRYDENGNRYGIQDEDLDPLVGVSSVSDASKYQSYVDPDAVQVSPLFKSDVSDLGNDEVNAKGERRGLVAFKIIGVGDDPDGNGSVLPNLIIEIVDPDTIDLSQVNMGSSGSSGGSDSDGSPHLVM